jgi:hypothetical protein
MNLFTNIMYVMMRCPPDWKESNTRDRCEHPDSNYSDPLLDAPVTSRSTNITYRNWYCASCHRDLDANTTVIWDAGFECEDYPHGAVSDEILEHITYSPSTLKWNLKIRKSTSGIKSGKSTQRTIQNDESSNNDERLYVCDIQFEAPEGVLQHGSHRTSCPGAILVASCPEDWNDNEVITKCEAFTARVCSVNQIFRNYYCSLCNNRSPTEFCSLGKELLPPFTILLDWRKLQRGKCAPTEIYDPLSSVCRKVFI